MKKSSAPIAPSRPELPKIVSIESLRARRDESGPRNAADSTNGIESSLTAGSAATDEAMSESERDRLIEELRSELVELPDVRLDKVIEARTKIARGYYDSERVRLDILGAMLEEERGPGAPSNPPSSKFESTQTTSATPASAPSMNAKPESATAVNARSPKPESAPPGSAKSAKAESTRSKARVRKSGSPADRVRTNGKKSPSKTRH